MIDYIKRIIQYSRNHKYITFVGFMVVMVIFALVLEQITPEPQPTEPAIVETPGTFLSIVFLGTEPTVPGVLPHYTSESNQVDPLAYAQQLAQQLNLPPAPQDYLDNLWIDPETGTSLDFQPTRGEIIWLSNTSEVSSTIGSDFDQDQAIDSATAFLSTLTTTSQLKPDINNIQFLHDETPVASPAEADIVLIPYQASLDKYPIYYSNNLNPVAKVFIQLVESYPVVKAVFSTISYEFEPNGTFPTRAITSAIQDVQTKEPAIIKDILVGGDQPYPNSQKNLEITGVSVEYRYRPTTATVEPYYRMVGTTYYLGEANTDIVIIAPATQTE